MYHTAARAGCALASAYSVHHSCYSKATFLLSRRRNHFITQKERLQLAQRFLHVRLLSLQTQKVTGNTRIARPLPR